MIMCVGGLFTQKVFTVDSDFVLFLFVAAEFQGLTAPTSAQKWPRNIFQRKSGAEPFRHFNSSLYICKLPVKSSDVLTATHGTRAWPKVMIIGLLPDSAQLNSAAVA